MTRAGVVRAQSQTRSAGIHHLRPAKSQFIEPCSPTPANPARQRNREPCTPPQSRTLHAIAQKTLLLSAAMSAAAADDVEDFIMQAADALAPVEPPTHEEQASVDAWLALERGEDVDPAMLHAALTLAGTSELFATLTTLLAVEDHARSGGADEPTLRAGAAGEAAPSMTRVALVRLCAYAAAPSPFEPAGLFHALRMLGEAHLTPPPEHDPERTWRTLFSTYWYPRLLSITPRELDFIKLAAAFLMIPREGSDDIVGAVCAQKWANVPSHEVKRELREADGAMGLYACAAKRFERAMAPFGDNVFRHVLDASRWRDNGWSGNDLQYAEEAVASFGEGASDFGLPGSLDFSWADDGTMFYSSSCGMSRSTLEEIHGRSEELRAKLITIDATIARDGEDAVSAPFTRARARSRSTITYSLTHLRHPTPTHLTVSRFSEA